MLAPRPEAVATIEEPSALVHRTVIGTYNLNYYNNAGGCISSPNPYFCVYVAPGPQRIPVPRGCYEVKVLSGLGLPGNAAVWTGSSASGRHFGLNPVTPKVRFSHRSGEISIYHYDWYPWDNDPAAVWKFELARIGTATGC
ncbi:MAG: hypothetical protein Q8K82_24130 [Gemmatimonadaceae bacterium]|nr:hypothetical protein [Gemmatimonadaceae bacterium]